MTALLLAGCGKADAGETVTIKRFRICQIVRMGRDSLRRLHERFPDKKLIVSEACIEYSKFAAGDYLKNAQKYAHDIIGNMNHGMNGFYDWNIVLDEAGLIMWGISVIQLSREQCGSVRAAIRMNWK